MRLRTVGKRMILSGTGMAFTPSAGVGWAPLGVELAIRKNRARVPKMVPTASVVSCRFLSFPVGSRRVIFGSKLISHAVPAKTFGAKIGTLRPDAHLGMTDSNRVPALDECALLAACDVGCGLSVQNYRDTLKWRRACSNNNALRSIAPPFLAISSPSP